MLVHFSALKCDVAWATAAECDQSALARQVVYYITMYQADVFSAKLGFTQTPDYVVKPLTFKPDSTLQDMRDHKVLKTVAA